MLDTSQDLKSCATELGCNVEGFFTPTGRSSKDDGFFGMDNGAFTMFNASRFLTMLEKHKPRIKKCRFVAAPDVVCSAIRTIECFYFWKEKINEWPIAFVCQDGQESYPIPWSDCAAIFIGGSTDWKMSKYAVHCIKAAQIHGKWCHVGRINTPGRFEYFEKLGVDSCDGSGLARFTHMREKIYRNKIEPQLFNECQPPIKL